MITVNAIDYVDIAKYTIDIYYIDDVYSGYLAHSFPIIF